MARQSTTPMQFSRTVRSDDAVVMTSGRAGKVVPIDYFPVLRGDSASGRVGIDVELAEMPRPALNGIVANVQAWFVPKAAHPQFPGYDEFLHSYQEEPIKALNTPDREPPKYFLAVEEPGNLAEIRDSEFMKAMGLHIRGLGDVTPQAINVDLIDAFSLIYNFRLAAHSSRLARRAYAKEDLTEALTLPRAFWPTGRFSRVVPDYERALIVGNLDLDVAAGVVPVQGIGVPTAGIATNSTLNFRQTPTLDNPTGAVSKSSRIVHSSSTANPYVQLYVEMGGYTSDQPNIRAEMEGSTIGVTLADIDKARVTQAMAKARTAYAGNDATGFDNDDAIIAELMQGFAVPEDHFKRPWLLDSKRVTFGMVERYATDAANLDASVSQGRASASLSINLPRTEVGGLVIITLEVLPEKIEERQQDEFLYVTRPYHLPDALRDIQRPEPVDLVRNERLDVKHSNPEGLYGYEPMNDKWNRSFTRLGGAFYQADPLNPWTEQRSAIWQAGVVDPVFSDDHYLCPEEFPHSIFADTLADAFEVVCRHTVKIAGITQIGDVLAENNDDYENVITAGEPPAE